MNIGLKFECYVLYGWTEGASNTKEMQIESRIMQSPCWKRDSLKYVLYSQIARIFIDLAIV